MNRKPIYAIGLVRCLTCGEDVPFRQVTDKGKTITAKDCSHVLAPSEEPIIDIETDLINKQEIGTAHSCVNKSRWKSKAKAMQWHVAWSSKEKTTPDCRNRLYPYECRWCYGWHLTKRKQILYQNNGLR
jgi:hypothetical protein